MSKLEKLLVIDVEWLLTCVPEIYEVKFVCLSDYHTLYYSSHHKSDHGDLVLILGSHYKPMKVRDLENILIQSPANACLTFYSCDETTFVFTSHEIGQNTVTFYLDMVQI